MTKAMAGVAPALADERLMTASEVAAHLGIPLQSLYRWRMEGKGPVAIRVGKHIRFTKQSLAQWISDQTEVR